MRTLWVGSGAVLISTHARQENLCVQALALDYLLINRGIHTGRPVWLLAPNLARMESHDSRAQPRIKTCLPVNVWIEESRMDFRAVMLDFSDTALRLARYFDMSPQFWMGIQMDYALDVASDELCDRLDREVRPYLGTG